MSLRAPDRFGRILGAGIVSLVACPLLLNLARITGLVSIRIGVLPFLGYGGLDLFVMLVFVGVLLSICVSPERGGRESPAARPRRALLALQGAQGYTGLGFIVGAKAPVGDGGITG